MKPEEINPVVLEMVKRVSGKRAVTVVDFIIKHGMITTDDLEKLGYIHPPRAVRDVRENGIPIVTFRIKGDDGKSIAAYKFGDPSDIQGFKLGGRSVFPKVFKTKLMDMQHGRCAICNEPYDDKFLQIDHRIPYEFAGDVAELDVSEFMLLCAECNKKKDRATEMGCKKTCFLSGDMSIIKLCFWASPENYTHICMQPIRRAEIVWQGIEVKDYDSIKRNAQTAREPLNEYIKRQLRQDIL